jgi:tetratricopeptide (TPR) repeat protein
LADYVLDRQAAMKLVNARKYEDAKTAFLKMAEGEVTDFQKSDALEQAARCASRLKQYDEAMKLAERIPLKPVSQYVALTLLMDQRKWKDVVDQYKDVDFTAWPDYIAGHAFHQRSRAYFYIKDGSAAEADLKKALDYIPDNATRASILLNLGQNYQSNLKDDKQALDAYMRVIELMPGQGSWINLTAITSAVSMLREQKKFDEAFNVLKTIDIDKLGGYWRGALLAAHGDVCAAQGKRAEAIARYKEALAVKGIPAYAERTWKKRLEEIQGQAE